MKKLLFIIVIFSYPQLLFAELKDQSYEKYFYIGKMKSYHDKFTLYFKTREKAIVAKGKNSNYITDYPQDLYIYDHSSKKEFPLISYDWFPKKAKFFFKSYKYPVFPEDFAYYLLNDNNTLILVSAFKDYNQNLIYDINKKELAIQESRGKLGFIISTYAQNCGYKSLKNNFECKIYKPLISKNLINSIE
tara:strand:+ start:86 stop:655 length:570 start_codon:yes stop_codon:yes gene_type:complete